MNNPEPTLFRWQTSWGEWTYRTERPAGWKDLPHFEAYILAAPAPSASPAALTDGCTEENCQRCRTPQELRTPNLRHAGIGYYPADQDEPSASPDALTDEQINEAFDSFCRNMSLVSVLYREDAQKFARAILTAKAQTMTDTGDAEAASPVALTDERVFELVGEVLGQPLIVEDLRQGFAVHTEPRDWLNFARALLAASHADPGKDARDMKAMREWIEEAVEYVGCATWSPSLESEGRKILASIAAKEPK